MLFVVAGFADEPQKVNELNKLLLQAAAGGNVDTVKSLLSRGVNVNVRDVYGQVPLHHAVVKGHKKIVELLIHKGANIDAKDNAGHTALHYAAGASAGTGRNNALEWSADMVRCLLDEGADIDEQDAIGWTPLHYATRMRCESIVAILLEKGADSSVTNNRGRMALSLAQRMSTLRKRTYKQAEIADQYRKIADFLSKDGCVYCVATNGKDSNPGTVQHPFRTLIVAISVSEPGDIILVRGGTYFCSSTIHIDKSGEQDKRIHLEAYPGETPVFDFSKAQNEGFFITGAYWHLRRLNITRAEHWGLKLETKGAHHNVIEQITTQANGVTGIALLNGATRNLVVNCDSYQNFDIETNGENADGFEAKINLGEGNVFIGCRAWNNSDDGFDLWDSNEEVRLEKCYAWANGNNIWNHPYFSGNANGFKLGKGRGRHLLIGCLCWGHRLTGATLNGNTSGVILNNCIFWDNDTNYFFEWSRWEEGARKSCVFSNNISYAGRQGDRINENANSQNNSWDDNAGIQLTDEDFLSFDDSIMAAPRNPDGSIPQSKFLKFSPTSDAIDKGVNVGMPFVGAKPDLGAFEYDPNENPQNYVKMLHQAVRDRDIKQIQVLLSEGNSVNEKDWLGYAPLHWAIYFGYSDMAEILISQGANPNLLSDTGRTPLEIAKAMKYNDIAELLRKNGAKK